MKTWITATPLALAVLSSLASAQPAAGRISGIISGTPLPTYIELVRLNERGVRAGDEPILVPVDSATGSFTARVPDGNYGLSFRPLQGCPSFDLRLTEGGESVDFAWDVASAQSAPGTLTHRFFIGGALFNVLNIKVPVIGAGSTWTLKLPSGGGTNLSSRVCRQDARIEPVR